MALALAGYLRTCDLKPRTCILNGERKDMFRVKRALRALQAPGYAKLRQKHPELPEITDRASLENTFKLLPMSMLALRVVKSDPHEGHDHGPKKTKRVKGLWTVRIEPQQEAGDDMYYVWLYEGSQVKTRLYALAALVLIFIVVCYPLWPLKLRLGVYYLSWGFLGLLGKRTETLPDDYKSNLNRTVLPDGNLPRHSLLHYLLRRLSRSLALPQLVGGCFVR